MTSLACRCQAREDSRVPGRYVNKEIELCEESVRPSSTKVSSGDRICGENRRAFGKAEAATFDGCSPRVRRVPGALRFTFMRERRVDVPCIFFVLSNFHLFHAALSGATKFSAFGGRRTMSSVLADRLEGVQYCIPAGNFSTSRRTLGRLSYFLVFLKHKRRYLFREVGWHFSVPFQVITS